MSNYEILASETEGKTRYFTWKKDGEIPVVYTKTEVDNIVNDVTSSIPEKLSQMDNDMGYITISDVPKVDTSYLATKGELKDVSDAIPTKTSQLTNDSGFITLADIPNIDIEGAVKDVQANGTSVLADGVANIPIATSTQAGLVRPVPANGIYVNESGTLNLSKLSNASLVNKNSDYAVLVSQIDLATKVGVTTNTIELTDEEKANACNWLGAVRDVQVNGTSIITDGVANIPIAGSNRLGLVFPAGFGVMVTASGALAVNKASDALIDAKENNFQPVVPSNLDYAVKVGITTNANDLTSEEKTNACNWLGAVKPSDLDNYATKTYVDEQIGNTGTSSGGGANVDLSNLSDTGKAVIDGKWVYKVLTIASDVEHTKTDKTYDISDYLPNDEYDYEVLFGGNAITYTTKGNYSNLYLKTDIIKSSVPICCIKTPAAAETISRTSTTLPVGVGRYIIVSSNSTIGGKYTLHAIGYKRLGTNP